MTLQPPLLTLPLPEDLARVPDRDQEALWELRALTPDLPEPLVVAVDGHVVVSWTEKSFVASAYRHENQWVLRDANSIATARLETPELAGMIREWWVFYESVLTTDYW